VSREVTVERGEPQDCIAVISKDGANGSVTDATYAVVQQYGLTRLTLFRLHQTPSPRSRLSLYWASQPPPATESIVLILTVVSSFTCTSELSIWMPVARAPPAAQEQVAALAAAPRALAAEPRVLVVPAERAAPAPPLAPEERALDEPELAGPAPPE
jgi:hypothetical protein